MSSKRYSIREVSLATGLEESEIRFFERVFREFLAFTQLSLDSNTFTEDHLEILRRIKQLIHGEGKSIDQVKRELKEAIGPRDGAPAATVNGAPDRPRRMARVISITSGKGGVGKTTITVNLAVAFAQMGKSVAIFDADLGLANVHILLGIKPRFNMRHIIEDNFSLSDVLAEGPLGIKLISGGQGVREMANLSGEQRRIMMRQLDRLEGEVDILIVDTGAGISENVLRFATFADETIVVTTPNVSAAADAYSIIKILLEMEPESKIGVIANQVASMYHSKNVYNRLNVAASKHLGITLGDLGYVLSDPKVDAANQTRKPLLLEYPDSEAAKNIRSIAETVLHGEVFRNKVKDSAFGDLMGALKRSFAGV